jgi:hypothetical protein
MVLIMRKDFNDAKKELNLANYILEIIIFMRLKFNTNKNFKDFDNDFQYRINEEDKFLKILEFLDNVFEYDNQDNYINISKDKDKEKDKDNMPILKDDNNNLNFIEENINLKDNKKRFSENFIMFSFLGGIFEKFYQQRIINFDNNNNNNNKVSESVNDNNNEFNKEIIDENIMNLICFYKDIIKMKNECEEKEKEN